MISLNLQPGFFTRTQKVCLAVVLTQLIFACSDVNSGDVAAVSGEQQGVTIPKSVRATAIAAEGTLEAYLYCDEVKQSMTIVEDIAQGSCAGLSTTSLHTIKVEFEFNSITFGGRFLLATATKSSVRAESGGTDLSFAAADFDTNIDNDGDLISNLAELEAGDNPGDPSCVIGQSLIGHCTL